MTKLFIKTIAPEELKKVNHFLEIQDRIEDFKEKHKAVFEQFEELVQEYNTALEDAEKEVRLRGVNCGPFVVCGEQTQVNVDKLYDELGENNFLTVGGTLETKRVLSVDKKRFAAMVDSNSIPKEVVETCFSRSLKYKVPHKAELP